MLKKFVVALSALTLSLSAGAALACGDDGCSAEQCALSGDKAHASEATEAKILIVKPGYTVANLSVDGMICVNCVNKVTATLKGLKGVDAVQVDLNAGKASISYDQKAVEPTKLVEAVAKLGYKVKQI